MSASALHVLAQVTLASSIAVLFVGVLRRPLRRVVGAPVAYWLWLALPLNAFALLIPLLRSSQSSAARAFARTFQSALPTEFTSALVDTSAMGSSSSSAAIALAMWLIGVIVMILLLVNRQRAFVRSLGRMTTDADATYRSDRIQAPMLIGAFRPQLVVPARFETLYTKMDRVLMLAHERTHRERGDPIANMFAAAWLCLFWFNPLMYWAMGRFRFDQELACDAVVLARPGTDRRRYANALLKAQLISESFWRMPVGCHWQSSHPLHERMLALLSPSF
jgi:bla regulator protein BlaR1